jgi:hypothetical protein
MQLSSSVQSVGLTEGASDTEIEGRKGGPESPQVQKSTGLLFRAAIFISLHLVFVVAGMLLYST